MMKRKKMNGIRRKESEMYIAVEVILVTRRGGRKREAMVTVVLEEARARTAVAMALEAPKWVIQKRRQSQRKKARKLRKAMVTVMRCELQNCHQKGQNM